jgi:hypothetical protein
MLLPNEDIVQDFNLRENNRIESDSVVNSSLFVVNIFTAHALEKLPNVSGVFKEM